jgi:hypothetical protein
MSLLHFFPSLQIGFSERYTRNNKLFQRCASVVEYNIVKSYRNDQMIQLFRAIYYSIDPWLLNMFRATLSLIIKSF